MDWKDVNCFIFCGAKCGSSTLAFSLNENNIKTIHSHSEIFFRKKFKKEKKTIFEIINEISNKKKIYIIDSYRTPIERKISSFFQFIHLYVPYFWKKTINELIDIFNNKYVNEMSEYHSINELFDGFNIKHFDEFNFEKGYNIKEINNVVFVKLLFKDINDWDKHLTEIFNKTIKITSRNIGEEKKYASIYKEFKEKYKVPKSYLNNILANDKEFKIYNTPEEQINYINYWKNRSI